MSRNILIVESDNDRVFVERVLKEINQENIEVEYPICDIDDYQCLNGLSEKQLLRKLKQIKKDISQDVNKLGILIDANSVGIDNRIALINKAVKAVLDESLEINAANKWFHSEKLSIDISCHILNIDGKGELETLLKTIKSADSIFADCLDTWRGCLSEQDKTIKDKDFDKFYIDIYQRFDHCSGRDKNQAGRKCSLSASLDKDIWDFSHTAIKPLKTYLNLFE